MVQRRFATGVPVDLEQPLARHRQARHYIGTDFVANLPTGLNRTRWPLDSIAAVFCSDDCETEQGPVPERSPGRAADENRTMAAKPLKKPLRDRLNIKKKPFGITDWRGVAIQVTVVAAGNIHRSQLRNQRRAFSPPVSQQTFLGTHKQRRV